MTPLPKWLFPAVLLSAALALISISYRHRVETRNKRVAIVTEIEAIEALATAQGIPLDAALVQLREKGLTGVVLSEETVASLLSEGDLTLANGQIFFRNRSVEDRCWRGLGIRFPGETVPSIALLRTVAVGLKPEAAFAIQTAELQIVARHANPIGLSAEGVRQTLAWSKELGAGAYLPLGDQVLGRRGAVPQLIESLETLDLLYASVEFGKMSGEAEVKAKAADRVVLMHSAQSAELDRLSPGAAVERYAKAARERNMRILLVRPLSNASAEPLTDFGDFMHRIGDRIRQEGGEIGPARPFENPQVPLPLRVALAWSVVPIAAFVAVRLLRCRALLLIAGLKIGLIAIASVTEPGLKLMALTAAVVFPVAGFLALDARRGKRWPVEFLILSGCSLVGGLCVAGLLNDLPYLIRASLFPGVKLAHLAPLALVGIYFFVRLFRAKEALRSPITWGAAALSLLLLILFLYMLTRTGNDSPASVSGLELRFRAILDALLPIRPRTKEFLIGHPLLILGIGLLIRARQKGEAPSGWIALLLTAGAIGQVSLVNTLEHLHTPIALGLLRIAIGLGCGMALGALLWLVIQAPPLRRLWASRLEAPLA